MTTTTTETDEVLEIVALANKLRPTERAKFVRALTESLNLALQLESFNTRAEWIEYLMAQPDAVVGSV